jgi:hypothetical protein
MATLRELRGGGRGGGHMTAVEGGSGGRGVNTFIFLLIKKRKKEK